VEAARQAGCTRVLVPAENWQESFRSLSGVEVLPVERLEQVLDLAFRVEQPMEPAEVLTLDLPLVPQPALALAPTDSNPTFYQ
jgi:Lon-like ATP-dependent protease